MLHVIPKFDASDNNILGLSPEEKIDIVKDLFSEYSFIVQPINLFYMIGPKKIADSIDMRLLSEISGLNFSNGITPSEYAQGFIFKEKLYHFVIPQNISAKRLLVDVIRFKNRDFEFYGASAGNKLCDGFFDFSAVNFRDGYIVAPNCRKHLAKSSGLDFVLLR